MHKVLIAMFVCVFSLSALACDGNESKGKKEKQEEQFSEFTK